MLISYHRGQGSVILRVKILNSSVSTGAGLTGLTSASSGLKISTIADNESAATTYTVAGSTIESITTLGTFAAPTATKCRFKELDSSGHPGCYEIHIADARYAVTSAKSLLVSISGATNAAECDAVIPLTDMDPYDSVRGGMTALPNAVPGAANGLFIAGSNAATTIAGLTTGALACSTITASGAVAFQSTFAVTTSTSLGALSATTITASGAVAFQSTFAVTTSTSLGALSCTTLTASGAVAFQSTFAVTTSTALGALSCTTLTASGAVAFQSTFATTGTTTFNAFTVTNALTISGTTTLTGAVSLGSTLGVTGATTFTGVVTMTNGLTANITGNLVGTVSTLTTYTGNTPQTGDAYARIGLAGAGLTALGDTRIANLDAAVTTRMATYTQPTGFLAATFPTTVASPTNITAGTLTTVTTLTNLPSIPNNWLTAAGIAASALNGKGDWLLSSGYTAPDNAGIATIIVGVNVAAVNGVTVGGVGTEADPWGPA